MSKPDKSFVVDPNAKGSYLRAANDIRRALVDLDIEKLPPVLALLVCYFGCEKIVRIVDGIEKNLSVKKRLKGGASTPNASQIIALFRRANIPISEENLTRIFDGKVEGTARYLRDKFVHELGPSHAGELGKAAASLMPLMDSFLRVCETEVLRLLTEKANREPAKNLFTFCS